MNNFEYYILFIINLFILLTFLHLYIYLALKFIKSDARSKNIMDGTQQFGYLTPGNNNSFITPHGPWKMWMRNESKYQIQFACISLTNPTADPEYHILPAKGEIQFDGTDEIQICCEWLHLNVLDRGNVYLSIGCLSDINVSMNDGGDVNDNNGMLSTIDTGDVMSTDDAAQWIGESKTINKLNDTSSDIVATAPAASTPAIAMVEENPPLIVTKTPSPKSSPVTTEIIPMATDVTRPITVSLSSSPVYANPYELGRAPPLNDSSGVSSVNPDVAELNKTKVEVFNLKKQLACMWKGAIATCSAAVIASALLLYL